MDTSQLWHSRHLPYFNVESALLPSQAGSFTVSLELMNDRALVLNFDVTTDSTYTERFMGMPNVTDNYQGYDEGDLSKHVDQLKDKQFLLVSSQTIRKIALNAETFSLIVNSRFTEQLTTMFTSCKVWFSRKP